MVPLLKSKEWKRRHGQGRQAVRLQAFGGLHYLKGNSLPYFSLTGNLEYNAGGRWMDEACGMIHSEILLHWPELKDLAALHLSDTNGKPADAVDNGFYWLAGSVPGHLGAEYHGGASGNRLGQDCALILAEHLRCAPLAVIAITCAVQEIFNTAKTPKEGNRQAREFFAGYCKLQEKRWKAEAKACIEKHGLAIYGDKWKGEF